MQQLGRALQVLTFRVVLVDSMHCFPASNTARGSSKREFSSRLS